MLDTLKVALADFQVAWRNRLTIQPSPVRAEDGQPLHNGLLWNGLTGKPVIGDKAYLNTDRYNLTVRPGRKAYGNGTGGPFALVSLSVPKFHHGDNVRPVDRADAVAVMHGLEAELAEAGLRTNINRAIVSRLDCAATVEASEPFVSYRPVFDLLEAQRSSKRDYGTTYLWHNGQQEYCVYDKREELRRTGQPTIGLPDNLLRLEHRLLNASKVRASTGIVTVADLLKEYGGLRGHYRQALKAGLFRYPVAEVETMAASEVEAGLLMFKGGNRYWGREWLQAVGAASIVRSIGPDALKVILNKHLDRNHAYRLTRHIQGLRFRLETAVRFRNGRTVAGLYRELMHKALAA